MAGTRFLENAYTFRRLESPYTTRVEPTTAEESVLARIDTMLAKAHQAYLARHYGEAIERYQEVEQVVYSLLDPSYSPGAGGGTISLSRDPGLFNALLSASLEWLNVLPPHQTEAPVRPRVAVDPGQLGRAAVLGKAGLAARQLDAPSAAAAAADWRLARAETRLGNNVAAAAYVQRARQTDEHAAVLLDQLAGQPAGANGIATQMSLALRPLTDAAVARDLLPGDITADRLYGVLIDGEVHQVAWHVSEGPPVDKVRELVYERRVGTEVLGDLFHRPSQPAEVAVDLPHVYYYVVPLGLAECHHALGEYEQAESRYLEAASYQFLNPTIEAPYLWLRLASLYRDWANNLFSDADDAAAALPIYEKVLLVDGTAPAGGDLYAGPLAPAAAAADTIIDNLAQLVDGSATATTLNVNPEIVAVILEVHQHLLQIQAGLDFWGNWHPSVPIWTFDYLQSAAINFAQLAVTAERDAIGFFERADQGNLTRLQLSQAIAQADAQVQLAQLQANAASSEASAYLFGSSLAKQRADDARANIDDYQRLQPLWTDMDAAISNDQLSRVAFDDDAEYVHTLFALQDDIRERGRLQRSYEVASMGRQAAELDTAAQQAEAELNAAKARFAAAQAAIGAAQARSDAARESLQAFDDQTFTPDVWSRMGYVMSGIHDRYMRMALQIARLMQRAYNFENDTSLALIKRSYPTSITSGLLGADSLMADIQSFSYDKLTSRASKPQPIRQSISLAQRYPFQFESQLRKTGMMEFQTRIEDFDEVYPGTYAGRIETVEVEVVGMVPPTGVSGTLTCGGVSSYRLPASIVGPDGSRMKHRVQSAETLVLSDYSPRQDALVVRADQRMLGIFEGAGLASTWRLELPPAVNDFDYRALVDVRLTLTYRARFDPELRDVVLQELAALPGATDRQRAIPLRWTFPDAFFHFQDTGSLQFDLRPLDFPSNHPKPVLTGLTVVVATVEGVSPAGLKVALSTPTQPAATEQADADGAISSDTPGSAWAALASGTAIGAYTLSMSAEDNPALVHDGALDLSSIHNLTLIVGYSFTPRA